MNFNLLKLNENYPELKAGQDNNGKIVKLSPNDYKKYIKIIKEEHLTRSKKWQRSCQQWYEQMLISPRWRGVLVMKDEKIKDLK